MKKILYYPGFEIVDQTWLKFSLLYMEGISTIVPVEAEAILSNEYKLIASETNLLDKYRPNPTEASRATRITLQVIREYLENPIKEYENFGEVNILDLWRNRSNQNTELFYTKFSRDLIDFCREWGLGEPTEYGIKIPNQLSSTYMGILAHSIGSKEDMSIITDVQHDQELKSFSDELWTYNSDFEELKYIKQYLSLQIPSNLNTIPLEKIIELRNSEDFQKKLKAFHLALSQLTTLNQESITEISFKEITENIEWSIKDLGAELVNFSSVLAITTFGIFQGFQSGESLEIIKESLGVIPTIGTGFQLYNRERFDNKRVATKYLTDLRNLNDNKRNRNLITNAPII